MAEKFQNKYRIQSARLENWDYRWAGAYFITICTHNREHYFGKIVDGKMILSDIGVLANECWNEILNHTKNVTLGEFVVMPNHVHGILILDNPMDLSMDENGNHHKNDDLIDNSDGNGIAQTRHALSLSESQSKKSIGQNRFQNPGKNSISSIIGGYKSAVTKHANRLELQFKWQTRFHDHIIRDQRAFKNISNYIINNPTKWGDDKFHC